MSWHYVFAAVEKLLQFTWLGLWHCGHVTPLPWSAADYLSIVSCCPSWFEVKTDRLGPGLWVSELHELPALTCVFLAYSRGVSHHSFVECVWGEQLSPGSERLTSLRAPLV
jgi:hypothetical protein